MSNTHQQSLADAGSETRPPMLERGSYIPWASRFRRYLNRKRENRKWLNKAIDEGPYEFRTFTPSDTEAPRMQKEEDLRGDDSKHYEAEIEAMNLILISITNDIYNSVDACKTTQAMWQRVEHLMRATVQNKVDRETRFNNEFDQFVAEPGEALVSVYNRFAQLMNDLERNDIIFPNVTVNTEFLNCLQFEWLKYVTQVRLAKRLTDDTYDDLTTSPYYVTHPSSVIDYDDDYQGDEIQNNSEYPLTSTMILIARAITQCFSNPTNNRLHTSSNTRNHEINDVGKHQRTLRPTSSRTAFDMSMLLLQEKGHLLVLSSMQEVRDLQMDFQEQMLLAKHDEAGVILTNEHNDFLFADASRMEEIEKISANICLMARIQPANFNSDAGASYDSAFLSEHPIVIIPLLPEFGGATIFDEPNDDANSSSIENDNNAQESYELEQLARNAY
ncbi:hypothetical protein Tco_1275087 [Tanacetum coccineum]